MHRIFASNAVKENGDGVAGSRQEEEEREEEEEEEDDEEEEVGVTLL